MAAQNSSDKPAEIRKPSASRKPDLRPSTSSPVPRIEPGRVESIGPQNLKNNITEAKKANLQLGGAEGEKQKEATKTDTAKENPSIIK